MGSNIIIDRFPFISIQRYSFRVPQKNVLSYIALNTIIIRLKHYHSNDDLNNLTINLMFYLKKNFEKLLKNINFVPEKQFRHISLSQILAMTTLMFRFANLNLTVKKEKSK